MLLEVNNLNIYFKTDDKNINVHAVRNFNFTVKKGEMLGVVGESGSGKSITNLALLGILPDTAIVTADRLKFDGINLLTLSEKDWVHVRGGEIAMIFQDPMSALNPFLTVEYQLIETILAHENISKEKAYDRSLELLEKVGITSPKDRMKAYPFELSGGMAQRVMIAMAISSNPKLLIADEPTTALDVTIQKQILNLLKELQIKNNMAVILVTHDLGIVAEYSDRIQVMYAGEMVESGTTHQIINNPLHPYTRGLLNSRPNSSKIKPKEKLPSIAGIVPQFSNRPSGCQFHPRCHFKSEECENEAVRLVEIENSLVRCIKNVRELNQ
jgi:oligopeptide/dipeptide ABC transporter ATP-binding protein